MSVVETRRHQMYPVLDLAQIETAKRFASADARSFAPGEVVFGVGERSAPAWLVLQGSIDVVGRDGLDREVAITSHGAGQISGELRQLTGRAALATGRAGPGAAPRCRSMPPICVRWWSARQRSARRSCAPSSCAASASSRTVA